MFEMNRKWILEKVNERPAKLKRKEMFVIQINKMAAT